MAEDRMDVLDKREQQDDIAGQQVEPTPSAADDLVAAPAPAANLKELDKQQKSNNIYRAANGADSGSLMPVGAPAYPAPVPGMPKKRNMRKIVVASIAILLALVVVGSIVANALRGPTPTYVQVQTVAKGQVKQTLSTTGLLSTGERVTVYSTVSAPLLTALPEAGSRVSKGDTLYTYDITDLERSYRSAAATQGSSAATAADSRNRDAENKQKIEDLDDNMNVYREERDKAKSIIASLQAQLDKVQAKIDKLTAAGASGGSEVSSVPASPELASLQKEAAELSGEIAVQQADLTKMESLIASSDATKEATEQTIMSPEAQTALSLQQVPGQVNLEMAADNLAAGEAGIRAPISGVVTTVQAEEGTLAAQYGPLCTIESLDKVNVIVALSRYDLENVKVGQKAVVTSLGVEYPATVTKIDGMATQAVGATGTSNYVNATVALDKPGSELHLGIEANVDIATGQVDDVIVVPITAVNTDVDGSYCYVAENNVAVRREVTLGLSNDSEIEITSGLKVGDELILSSQSIIEGANISTDAAYAPAVTPTVNMPMM